MNLKVLAVLTDIIMYFLVGLMLVVTYVACAQSSQVTGITPPAAEDLQPLIDLLAAKQGSWLATLLAWMGTVSVLLSPFAVRIRNMLADMLNDTAATESEEDDAYLLKLFSQPWYRFLSFVLGLINIRFPTLSELQRAIRLQKEAVEKAKCQNTTSPIQ